jgi:hypothetical protein
MPRFVALIAVVAALVAFPAAALAQDNPFVPDAGQPAPQQNTPPPPAPVDEDGGDDGDMGGGVVIGVGIAVVALIGGIWFAITRDARNAVPQHRRPHTARAEPDADARATPGSRGRHATRAAPRGRKHSKQEQARRKRGRAR